MENIAVLDDIVSVNHADLDRQHKMCADALEQLRTKADAASLRDVLSAYEHHFNFEENLLDKHLYKGTTKSKGFSAAQDARKSHYKDHSRLINEIRGMLSGMNDEENVALVPKSFVDKVLRNFENHANVYDDAYKDALTVALE